MSKNLPGTLPLYRYWSGRDHFYTLDITEIGVGVAGIIFDFKKLR